MRETEETKEPEEIKEMKESSGVQDKIWDRVFKTMLQEQPALFVPLINLVFKKRYERYTSITSINTETYNKDKSRILSDIAFLIGDISYHFECQYTNDHTMAFHMFEYDFHIALADSKRTNNLEEFNFPHSCVFYVVPKESMPKFLRMQINFQDGSYNYTVPVIRMYDYSLDEIEQKELYLFLPYEILRHIRNVTTEKHIAEYAVWVNDVYTRMIRMLEAAYCRNKLKSDELLTLLNMLNDTAEYKLEKYPQIWKGVYEMLNSLYVPRWKIELEQAKREMAGELREKVTKEVTAEVTNKVTAEVTNKVTKETELEMMILMKKNGGSEEMLRAIAEAKKIPSSTLEKILHSCEAEEALV